MSSIKVKNSYVNNLAGISCEFPRGALSVVCGASGSGKFSLVFGTVYREFLKFAIRNLGYLPSGSFENRCLNFDGSVDSVDGLSFVVALSSKDCSLEYDKSRNVASYLDATSVLDRISKLLYSCQLDNNLNKRTPISFPGFGADIVELAILDICGRFVSANNQSMIICLANLSNLFVCHVSLFTTKWSKLGFSQFFINNRICDFCDIESFLEGETDVCIAVVVDYFPCICCDRFRISELMKTLSELSMEITIESLHVSMVDSLFQTIADSNLHCVLPISLFESLFGLGNKIFNWTIADLNKAVVELLAFGNSITDTQLKKELTQVEIVISSLISLGLANLGLSRSLASLSSGELRRLRFARLVQSRFTGVTYLFEHPTSGLHFDEEALVVKFILSLVQSGNTVICITHDMRLAQLAKVVLRLDSYLETQIWDPESTTTSNCSKTMTNCCSSLSVRESLSTQECDFFELLDITCCNLKSIDLKIPLGRLSAIICKSSCSGKSILMRKCLYPVLRYACLNKARGIVNIRDLQLSDLFISSVVGLERLRCVRQTWKSSILTKSRSTISSITGIESVIRSLFSMTQEAKIRGLTPRHFSRFSDSNGDCSSVGSITYGGIKYSDIQFFTIEQLRLRLHRVPRLKKICDRIVEAGLGYLILNINVSDISHGELQRLRFVSMTMREDLTGYIFLLDEPTSCMTDSESMIFLQMLREVIGRGATIVIAEDNLKFAFFADYVAEIA